MGEMSEEVRVLVYGERIQESREQGSDRAPCGSSTEPHWLGENLNL